MPEDIDIFILCGGFGTRLQGVVKDRPKPMIPINGKPFLEIIIDHFASFGFKRFILCAHYKLDVIRANFTNYRDLDIEISEESRPLGTAGAIKNAESFIKSGSVMVVNGDSFCPIDPNSLISCHKQKGGIATVVITETDGRNDAGYVKLGEDDKIVSFSEKKDDGCKKYINAGIYLFDRKFFDQIDANNKVSLENDIFPKLTGNGLYGQVVGHKMYDIGTPERLEHFQQVYQNNGSLI